MSGDERRAAAALREVLTVLGPAFVKIGQALSSRPDIMSPEYLVELEKLQDRIPPFPDDQALQVGGLGSGGQGRIRGVYLFGGWGN